MKYTFWVLAVLLGISAVPAGVDAAAPMSAPVVQLQTRQEKPLPPAAVHVNGDGVTAKPAAADDFYMHVNYDWMKKTKIPPEDSSYGSFRMVDDRTREQLTAITKEAIRMRGSLKDTDPKAQIADMYACITDEKGREQAGLGKAEELIKNIEQAATLQEFADTMGTLAREHGISVWLGGFVVAPDPVGNDTYVVYLQEPSTGLGKEFLENKDNEPYFTLYKQYMTDMLTAYGRQPEAAAQTAEKVFAFQQDLAAHAMPVEDLYDPAKATHKLSYDDVVSLYGHIRAGDMLRAAGIGPDQMQAWYVQDLGLMEYFNSLYTDERLPMLKEYAVFRILSTYAPYVNKKYADIKEEFGRAMSGAKVKKSRQRHREELNEELLYLPYGKVYAQQCFDEERKATVVSYVQDILGQYKKRLAENDWLSRETKTEALKKLDTMAVHIGYPDKWQPFMDSFAVRRPEDGGVLIDNVCALQDAEWQYEREKIGKAVDRDIWDGIMPQVVNAFYNPGNNSITFPAAILQPPFFEVKADRAANLGGIGMVIAHEITHSFDSNGAQYDEKGRLRNWWTQADWDAFHQHLDGIIALYNRYEITPGVFADGKQTLSENIADLGAIACLSGIIGDDKLSLRRMYASYASVWREKQTEARLRRVMTDVHSLSYIRVNAVLSATDSFYDAFDVQPDDGMYIAPENRVKLW